MKTLPQTKIVLLILLGGLAFSCKKNETVPVDSTYDSIQHTIDTVGPEVDTIMDDTMTDSTAIKEEKALKSEAENAVKKK